MKVLRKGFLVVVQLVAATSFLLQQCPVLALATPDLNRSENEVTESAVDQGDEAIVQNNDSAIASANDELPMQLRPLLARKLPLCPSLLIPENGRRLARAFG